MADRTFNEALLAAMVAHQTGLLRFSGSTRNAIWELLDATEADLKAQIATAGRLGLDTPARVARTNRLLELLRETRAKAWDEIRPLWRKEMRELVKAEPKFLDNIIAGAVPVILGSDFPTAEALQQIVTSRPYEGKTLNQWMRSLQAGDAAAIESAIKIGLVQNETLPELSRRVVGTVRQNGRDGVTQTTRRHIDTITRTLVSGMASDSREEYLRLNKDLAPQKLFTATLDSRTTPVCRGFDGQTWAVDDPSAPVFPLHFGERSLYVPVVDGEVIGERPRRNFTQQGLVREYARENGIDITVPSSLSAKEARNRLPRGTKGDFDKWSRGRMRELTGQVPATESYQVWLGGRSAAFQDDILGPTRGRLFRRGDLTLDRFVAQDGTELTLRQLAQRNAAAFERAGLDPSEFL